ncbi:MAG: methyl-accepting chemotaxis protein [Methanobacteriota archaeon]
MRFLDNIRVGRKLIGSFLLIVVVLLIVGCIGAVSVVTLSAYLNDMYLKELVPTQELGSIGSDIWRLRGNTAGYVALPSNRENLRKQSEDLIKLMDANISAYQRYVETEEEKEIYSRLVDSWKKYLTAIDTFNTVIDTGNQEEIITTMTTGDLIIARADASKAIQELISYKSTYAGSLSDEVRKSVSIIMIIIIGAIIIGGVIAITLGTVISRSITIPLSKAVWMLQEMSNGHLSHRLTMDRRDEIGILAATMDSYSEVLQSIARGMTNIGEGNLSITVIPKDDKDEFSPAMVSMLEALRGLVADSKALSQAAVEGKLATRGDVLKFQGGYREIIEGFNGTLDCVINPVNEAMRLASSYAKGDYTDRISESLQVKGDFIPFTQALNQIGIDGSIAIGGVKNEVESLTAGMEETNASAQEVAGTTNILAQNSSSVSELAERSGIGVSQTLTAMEDLSSTVSAVATKAENASIMANNTVELSKKGLSLAGKAEKGMERIILSFEETGSNITDITSQMDNIGKIVGIITGIAEQTGLLALNAAIEAARAGDAGRGFAVVADEVKSLALESQKSAEDITTIIGDLQKKSSQVSESMKSASIEVKAGNTAVTETLGVFHDIGEAVNIVHNNMTEVAAATEEQAAAVEEITASIHEVGSLVQQTAQEAVDSAAATEEVTATIDQITRAISDASASIQNIASEMEKFKVT